MFYVAPLYVSSFLIFLKKVCQPGKPFFAEVVFLVFFDRILILDFQRILILGVWRILILGFGPKKLAIWNHDDRRRRSLIMVMKSPQCMGWDVGNQQIGGNPLQTNSLLLVDINPQCEMCACIFHSWWIALDCHKMAFLKSYFLQIFFMQIFLLLYFDGHVFSGLQDTVSELVWYMTLVLDVVACFCTSQPCTRVVQSSQLYAVSAVL